MKTTLAASRSLILLSLTFMAIILPKAPIVAQSQCPGEFRVEYFDNQKLKGFPIGADCVEEVGKPWSPRVPVRNVLGGKSDGSATEFVSLDHNFSARWTKSFELNGRFIFKARADDGVRVFLATVEGRQYEIISGWRKQRAKTYQSGLLNLKGCYTVVVEYFQAKKDSEVSFWIHPWQQAANAGKSGSGAPTCSDDSSHPSRGKRP